MKGVGGAGGKVPSLASSLGLAVRVNLGKVCEFSQRWFVGGRCPGKSEEGIAPTLTTAQIRWDLLSSQLDHSRISHHGRDRLRNPPDEMLCRCECYQTRSHVCPGGLLSCKVVMPSQLPLFPPFPPPAGVLSTTVMIKNPDGSGKTFHKSRTKPRTQSSRNPEHRDWYQDATTGSVLPVSHQSVAWPSKRPFVEGQCHGSYMGKLLCFLGVAVSLWT